MSLKQIHFIKPIILLSLFVFCVTTIYAQKSVTSGVYFKTDASDVSAAGKKTLDSMNYLTKKFTDISIEIYGNSDSIGSTEKNMKLSESRMLAVKLYLLARGVSDKRIKGFAYGAEKSKFRNSDEYNRAKNRRVDVILKGKKLDFDTVLTSGQISIKIPAYTYAPYYNAELNFKIINIYNYQLMAANGLTNIDSTGVRLNSAGMVCLKATTTDGKPALADKEVKELVVNIPVTENDPKLTAWAWSQSQDFTGWKGTNLPFSFQYSPAPHYELHVSSNAIINGNLCVNAGKEWPRCNCKSAFATHKLPTEADTTVRFLENCTVVKFDGGSFAPLPIKSVVMHLDSFATPGMLIKDSVSSLYEGDKFLPYTHMNHITFSTFKGKKLKIRPGHKATVYYYAGDTAKPYELSIGERDSTGNVRWHKPTVSVKQISDPGYAYLEFDINKGDYISSGDPFALSPVAKAKNLSPNNNFQVKLAGNLHPSKIYVLYTQTGVVQDLRPDANGILSIAPYDKFSSIKLIVTYSELAEDYIFQSSLARLKFDEKEGYFSIEKKDFRKAGDGKSSYDLIR